MFGQKQKPTLPAQKPPSFEPRSLKGPSLGDAVADIERALDQDSPDIYQAAKNDFYKDSCFCASFPGYEEWKAVREKFRAAGKPGKSPYG